MRRHLSTKNIICHLPSVHLFYSWQMFRTWTPEESWKMLHLSLIVTQTVQFVRFQFKSIFLHEWSLQSMSSKLSLDITSESEKKEMVMSVHCWLLTKWIASINGLVLSSKLQRGASLFLPLIIINSRDLRPTLCWLSPDRVDTWDTTDSVIIVITLRLDHFIITHHKIKQYVCWTRESVVAKTKRFQQLNSNVSLPLFHSMKMMTMTLYLYYWWVYDSLCLLSPLNIKFPAVSELCNDQQ